MSFRTCSACQRHVKAHEGVCPFCGHGSDGGHAVRLAVGGAIVLGAVAGCMTHPAANVLYGGPIPPSQSGPVTSPTPPGPQPQPLYGAFAPTPSPTPTPDGPRPLYGAVQPQ